MKRIKEMWKQFFSVCHVNCFLKIVGKILIIFWIIEFYAFNSNSIIHLILLTGMLLLVPTVIEENRILTKA